MLAPSPFSYPKEKKEREDSGYDSQKAVGVGKRETKLGSEVELSCREGLCPRAAKSQKSLWDMNPKLESLPGRIWWHAGLLGMIAKFFGIL